VFSLGDIQPESICDLQQVANVSYIPRYLGQKVWTAGVTTVVPPLQFMEKEKCQRRAGEPVNLDYEVWVDIGKVQSPWYEDVDFEPLEAGFVAVGAPVQNFPLIFAVPRPHGEETVVVLAKVSLDSLRAAPIRCEAKNVEVLI